MRFLLLLFALLLTGCAATPVVDYERVETRPHGKLLPPPEVPVRELGVDTYYPDVEDVHLSNLKKYHTYITRQIQAVDSDWGRVREHCVVAELPQYVPPPKPHIHADQDPELVVMELGNYIRALKLAQNQYQSAVHDAVVRACKR